MEFKNTPNCSYLVELPKGKEKTVWESRSVAINGCIIIFLPNHKTPYVLASRRGPNSADYQGMMNLIAGYLDWDETGTEALYREAWEEVGLDLKRFAFPEGEDAGWYDIATNDLLNPWQVETDPNNSNRQNVSLRYGFICRLKEPRFPDLSLANNEVDGEVSEAWWMPVNEINKHEWAFNHDKVIKDYLAQNGLLSHVFET